MEAGMLLRSILPGTLHSGMRALRVVHFQIRDLYQMGGQVILSCRHRLSYKSY